MQVAVDGRDVFVHTGGGAGPTDGQVVVLLHGAGNDHSVWRYQTRLLASSGVPVAAVDLPGHGRSRGPALESVAAMGEWVLALLDALGVEAAALAGHSMGSLIAMSAAAADPGRIGRLALVGTATRMTVHPALKTAADARDPAAIDMIVGWSHTARSRFGGHPQAGVWTAAQTRRLLERNLAVLGTDLAACAAHDGRATAERLAGDHPGLDVLVISGGRDLMTPSTGGGEVAALVGARHHILPEGSHVSLYDHPEAVNAALVPFLSALQPTG